ncbi:MAG: hypothetical protein SFX72_10845 [Isosphaeraceae bacterium]|nr:hypothetical protein [Isosphaeraceae bacterium]
MVIDFFAAAFPTAPGFLVNQARSSASVAKPSESVSTAAKSTWRRNSSRLSRPSPFAWRSSRNAAAISPGSRLHRRAEVEDEATAGAADAGAISHASISAARSSGS